MALSSDGKYLATLSQYRTTGPQNLKYPWRLTVTDVWAGVMMNETASAAIMPAKRELRNGCDDIIGGL